MGFSTAPNLMEHYSAFASSIGACAEQATVYAPWDRSPIGTVDVINSQQADQVLETAFAIYQDKSRWLRPRNASKCWKKPHS